MTTNRRLALLCLLGSFHAMEVQADNSLAGAEWSIGGHIKYQAVFDSYPENSAFRDLLGRNNLAQSLATRLNAAAESRHWHFSVDYQLIAIRSDALHIANSIGGLPAIGSGAISDRRRWWDLTNESAGSDRSALVNRLDRLYIGYTSSNTVWRFGRQAISWGNGLLFTPMDVFNPFDPAAVDKEYKPGDDMLYAQRLFENGADLQGLVLLRRDPLTGNVESDQSSLAFKYHGFIGNEEFDLLLAKHYGDRLVGFGGIVGLGGAIWRGDLTWTDTDRESVVSAVTSINYSWTWGGHNVSGLAEYYFTEFGQKRHHYAIDQLQQNVNLWQRLERGELFTLGRHYLATSLTVELTPLFRLTPNVFLNLQDPSALVQLVAQYDWQQDVTILTAVNVPVGPDSSEYGGPESDSTGKHLSADASLLFQLAFYF